MHALVAEVMKKAVIVWLAAGADLPTGERQGTAPAYPIWCLGMEDAICLVTGEGEQPAPGVADGATVAVSARGDHGGRIVTWTATARRVAPGSETWDTVAPQLAGKRLNASGTGDVLLARWAAQCAIYRLVPVDDAAETGADPAAPSGATTPLPTPATRRTPNPFRLHRVKHRK